ncbi:MAG: FAD-dependent oxidoreductase [Gemmatimonadota bacterium]|nr:FAD-dependent oxidoreductase [Gemmatimonadota bacterium]
MNERAWEYVIVGGGIYGVATAWHLASAGGEVLVLEGRTVASGASGGLGKRGVRANGRDLRELPLMRAAYEVWPTLEADLGHPTGWERVGHLRLYERHHDVGAARARAWAQGEAGIETYHLDRSGVREIEPGLSDVVLGALHCPNDGVADHSATTAGYAAQAREAGVVIREGAVVSAVEVTGGRAATVVLAGGERITVRGDLLLLNNTGVAPLVSASFGRSLPVWKIFPQAMCTDPVAEPPFSSLFGHAHRPLALKMVPGGAVMASGGWRGRWNPERGEGEALPDAVRGNWAEAVRVFPVLEDLEPRVARADRAESACVDDIPIIDRLPEASNVIVGTGWSGHGWAIAPAAAPLIAQWAREGGDAPGPLRPFRLGRFMSRR